jgi:NHL repeat
MCDTLNNKIKCVEVDGTRSAYSKTYIGSGVRGSKIDVGGAKGTEKGAEDKDSLLRTVELDSPQGVAYDRAKKMIYIADSGNNRILAVNRATSDIFEIKLDFSRIQK